MKDLAALCTGFGFARVRTSIQSGNAVFASRNNEEAVREVLAASLSSHLGRTPT